MENLKFMVNPVSINSHLHMPINNRHVYRKNLYNLN